MNRNKKLVKKYLAQKTIKEQIKKTIKAPADAAQDPKN